MMTVRLLFEDIMENNQRSNRRRFLAKAGLAGSLVAFGMTGSAAARTNREDQILAKWQGWEEQFGDFVDSDIEVVDGPGNQQIYETRFEFEDGTTRRATAKTTHNKSFVLELGDDTYTFKVKRAELRRRLEAVEDEQVVREN